MSGYTAAYSIKQDNSPSYSQIAFVSFIVHLHIHANRKMLPPSGDLKHWQKNRKYSPRHHPLELGKVSVFFFAGVLGEVCAASA